MNEVSFDEMSVAKLAERLDSRLAALDRLAAIESIHVLKARYLSLWDALMLKREGAGELASLFAQDAVVDLGELAGVHRGRADIESCYSNLAAARPTGPRCTKHLATNPVIEVDGDKATGLWQLVWLAEDQAGRCLWSLNHYDETYQRNPDGGWRFSSLRLVTERSPGHLVVKPA